MCESNNGHVGGEKKSFVNAGIAVRGESRAGQSGVNGKHLEAPAGTLRAEAFEGISL